MQGTKKTSKLVLAVVACFPRLAERVYGHKRNCIPRALPSPSPIPLPSTQKWIVFLSCVLASVAIFFFFFASLAAALAHFAQPIQCWNVVVWYSLEQTETAMRAQMAAWKTKFVADDLSTRLATPYELNRQTRHAPSPRSKGEGGAGRGG